MPRRESRADLEWARRRDIMLGPVSSREWDEACGYSTAAGALVKAAQWRRVFHWFGRAALAGHAAAIADARRLRARP